MDSGEDKKPDKKGMMDAYARYSSMAIQMALIIGGGSYLGHWLDSRSDSDFALWTLILSLSSVILALYIVLKQVIDHGKRDD